MIQKSELKQVPVEQRVPGRIYAVSDSLEGKLDHTAFRVFKLGNESTTGVAWAYWFGIPKSMLPVREVQVMPDEFEVTPDEWEYTDNLGNYHTVKIGSKFRRIKPNPNITIPSGSKSEQIEQLEKILAELKQS